MTPDWQANPGHMPVKPDVLVQIILRGFEDAPTFAPHKAGSLRWCRTGTLGDIEQWRKAGE